MSTVDFSDPEIAKLVKEVSSSAGINFVIVGYAKGSKSKLEVKESGEDGIEELCECLDDSKIQFALVQQEINGQNKLAYIAWCGESVQGSSRGVYPGHSTQVERLFRGYHVRINATCIEDVEEEEIIKKLKKSTGADYGSGDKSNASRKTPTTAPKATTAAPQKTSSASSAVDKDKERMLKQRENMRLQKQNKKKKEEEEKLRLEQEAKEKREAAEAALKAERQKYYEQFKGSSTFNKKKH